MKADAFVETPISRWPSMKSRGIGGLLMTCEVIGSNTTAYLPLYDAMGNVHAMLKASDGTIAAAYEYDAFARTLRADGADFTICL